MVTVAQGVWANNGLGAAFPGWIYSATGQGPGGSNFLALLGPNAVGALNAIVGGIGGLDYANMINTWNQSVIYAVPVNGTLQISNDGAYQWYTDPSGNVIDGTVLPTNPSMWNGGAEDLQKEILQDNAVLWSLSANDANNNPVTISILTNSNGQTQGISVVDSVGGSQFSDIGGVQLAQNLVVTDGSVEADGPPAVSTSGTVSSVTSIGGTVGAAMASQIIQLALANDIPAALVSQALANTVIQNVVANLTDKGNLTGDFGSQFGENLTDAIGSYLGGQLGATLAQNLGIDPRIGSIAVGAVTTAAVQAIYTDVEEEVQQVCIAAPSLGADVLSGLEGGFGSFAGFQLGQAIFNGKAARRENRQRHRRFDRRVRRLGHSGGRRAANFEKKNTSLPRN
jgi:hypothetical protein